jgi:hypothetical protein
LEEQRKVGRNEAKETCRIQNGVFNDDSNSVEFFIYFRAEMNSRWSVTKSTRIQKNKRKQTENKDKLVKLLMIMMLIEISPSCQS